MAAGLDDGAWASDNDAVEAVVSGFDVCDSVVTWAVLRKKSGAVCA